MLSANIHHGTAEAEALVDLVDRHQPDLLAIQELTPSFARDLRRAGLDRRLPNAILETRRSASGAGIYSHLPMRKLGGEQPFFFRQPRAEVRLPDGQRSASSTSIPTHRVAATSTSGAKRWRACLPLAAAPPGS